MGKCARFTFPKHIHANTKHRIESVSSGLSLIYFSPFQRLSCKRWRCCERQRGPFVFLQYWCRQLLIIFARLHPIGMVGRRAINSDQSISFNVNRFDVSKTNRCGFHGKYCAQLSLSCVPCSNDKKRKISHR